MCTLLEPVLVFSDAQYEAVKQRVQIEKKFIGKWCVRKGYKRERRYAILMIAEVSLWEGDKTHCL